MRSCRNGPGSKSYQLGAEPANAAFILPKFDEISAAHLFGVFNRSAVVRKIDTCRRTLRVGVRI
jgi:hypothetical protein